MERDVKEGFAALAAVAVVAALLGGCAGKAISDAGQQSAVDAALTELRGTGNVPGTTDGQESSGSFMPSDSPPACLPNGTVTYEIYDEAADMRWWVFRWPENGGYSVVPRLKRTKYGAIAPYTVSEDASEDVGTMPGGEYAPETEAETEQN